MAVANLNTMDVQVNTSRDNIIIRDNILTKRGGKTLNTTGFTDAVIYAGNPIIKETATGEYKPLGNDGTNYIALPAGHTYEGVCNKTTLTKEPFVGILTMGEVNHKAAYHKYDNILAAIKTALPQIIFKGDKE